MPKNPWKIRIETGGVVRDVTLRIIAGEILQNAYAIAVNPPIFDQPPQIYRARLRHPLEVYAANAEFPEQWRTRLEALADDLAAKIVDKSAVSIQEKGWLVLSKAREYTYTVVRTTSIRLTLRWAPTEGLYQHDTISQAEAAALLPGAFDYYYDENQSVQFYEVCRRLKLTGRIMFRRPMKYAVGDMLVWADMADPEAKGRDMSFTFRKVTYLGKMNT